MWGWLILDIRKMEMKPRLHSFGKYTTANIDAITCAGHIKCRFSGFYSVPFPKKEYFLER